MPEPLRLAFLGCGFITRVHSRNLRRLGRRRSRCRYASRDRARADAYCRRYGGATSYGDYDAAIADPHVDAVVIAVPPAFHLDLTLQALAAGKHVLVEKPAFPRMADYETVRAAATAPDGRAGRRERSLQAARRAACGGCSPSGAIGDLVFAHFTTIAKRLKTADDWRNDETMAGGDAFFEEGIHWLHLAGSLGPRITAIEGFRPPVSADGGRPPRQEHDGRLPVRQRRGRLAVLLARNPVALQGLRLSKLFGRNGIITFESNGAFVLVRGKGLPRLIIPGFTRHPRLSRHVS